MDYDPKNPITLQSLSQRFGGNAAIPFMAPIMAHFKQSCMEAKIVDETTWNANLMLVTAAVYCWSCDQTPKVRQELLSLNRLCGK